MIAAARARSLSATLLLALAATAAGASGSHLSPRARLEHEKIGLDQVTALVIEVESSGRASVAFEPDFDLENLEIVGRPSRSDVMTFANGRRTRKDSLIWTLRPLAVGPAYVQAIRVSIDDRIFVLDDLALEVQRDPVETERPAGRRSPFDDLEEMWDPFGRRGRQAAPAARPKIFLRAEVTPRDPYVGQQALYTLYLFTQADVAAIDPAELPDFAGLWVHDLPQPDSKGTEMTQVDDERYGRAVLLRKALFPLRPGQLEIGPVSARMAIKVPAPSFYGPLLDRVEEVKRTSNRVTIDARPLPPPPDGFAGAVGRLSLAVDLQPTELRVGEAATLKVTLAGEGHIQGLGAPALAPLEGLRRFPPEQGGTSRASGSRVRGERTWSYVLVPDRAGRWQLDPIEYPYFDPAAGEYRVAASEPRVLVAHPEPVAATAEAPAPTAAEAEPPPAPAAAGWPRWLLGLAALVPVLLILALRGVRGGGPRRRRAQRLKERLRAAAGQRRPRQAALEVETAWREYLRERLGIDSPGPPDTWGDLLDERGLEPAAAEQMDRLAEDLQYLRLAPELSSTRAVRQDLLQHSQRLLRILG